MRIAKHFTGPPTSGQGGITCGLMAAHLDAPVVEVTLRKPPPLEVDIEVVDGTATYDGEVIATAAPGEVTLQPPPSVGVEGATGLPSALGPHQHPFPTCFVCGPDNPQGLHLMPGRLTEDRTAVPWTPIESSELLVWAALDCPGGWSVDLPGRPMVLGRMAAVVDALPAVGEPHVLQGWLVGTDGRKVHTGSALYDAEGAVLAVAQATWIRLS